MNVVMYIIQEPATNCFFIFILVDEALKKQTSNYSLFKEWNVGFLLYFYLDFDLVRFFNLRDPNIVVGDIISSKVWRG